MSDLNSLSDFVEVERFEAGDSGYAIDIAVELDGSLPAADKMDGGWQYVATSEMAGLPTSCRMWSCRNAKLIETASFSALFADRVVVPNPISHALFSISICSEINQDHIDELLFAIHQVQILKPLYEAGIVVFEDFSPEAVCQDCFAKLYSETMPDAEKFPIVEIYKEIINSVTVSYDGVFNEHFVFTADSSELYPEHGGAHYYLAPNTPDALSDPDFPFSKGDILSHDDVHRLGLMRKLSEFFSSDFVIKNSLIERSGVKNLASSEIEVRALEKSFGESFLRKSFPVELPYVASKNLSSVLKIRENEWHHFEEYRDRIQQIATNVSETDATLEQVYRSEVLPEFIKLEKIIRRSRTKLKGDLIDNVGLSVASILASVATAGASNVLSGIAAALGGGHFAKSMVPNIRKLVTEPPELQDSSYYYAWKVRKELE